MAKKAANKKRVKLTDMETPDATGVKGGQSGAECDCSCHCTPSGRPNVFGDHDSHKQGDSKKGLSAVAMPSRT
jgi:hypothetical protein